MASTRDVQDMLGLTPQTGPRPKPSKKKAPSSAAKGDGVWNKEIRGLIGERAPPAHLLEAQPKFQKKRAAVKTGPVRRWILKPFKNDARTDDLLLRHWKRTELESKPFSNEGELSEGFSEAQQKAQAELETPEDSEYKFGAKYNPDIDAPSFDHDVYEKNLQNDDWTEAETHYLVETYKSAYGKWPVVWDRYEWDRAAEQAELRGLDAPETTEPNSGDYGTEDVQMKQEGQESNTEQPNAAQSQVRDYKPRTLEELKHRFYGVTAVLLALHTPPTQMTASQYRLHEQMSRYNPQGEAQRKRLKEVQMTRSKEEKREEEYLLTELRRIYFGQERVDNDLRELRSRLDHSMTDDRNPGHQYTSSRELQEIFNRFIRKENMQRPPGAPQPSGVRRSLGGQADAAGAAGSPTGSIAATGQRKGSIAATTEGGAHPTVRHLSPRAALKNGLSSHERLASGVTFRSDKITKIRQQSKSAQVNNKIALVLQQIDVPEFVLMPTVSVTQAVEKVVGAVANLVEMRRNRERVEGEVKVLEKMLGLEEKQPEGEGASRAGDAANKDASAGNEDGDNGEDGADEEDAQGSPDDDDGDDNAADATEGVTTRRKRSASEVSASSSGSRAGVKRQKSTRK